MKMKIKKERRMNQTKTATEQKNILLKDKQATQSKRMKRNRRKNKIKSINNQSNINNTITSIDSTNLLGTQLTYQCRKTNSKFTETNPLKNEQKGHSHNNKDEEDIRFLFQNIHGLQPNDDTEEKWKATILRMIKLKCDIVGLCETCLNGKDNKLRKRFRQILSYVIKNGTMLMSTTSQKHPNKRLPGGTASITLDRLTSYITGKIYDNERMGRWTGTSYRVSNNKHLHIITAYRVCPNNTKSETNSLSTYSQQYAMMIEKGYEKPNPRKQFITDFISQFKKLCTETEDYILVAMDANEHPSNSQEGINKIKAECELIDVYTEIHGEGDDFPTHENGSKRVDYAFCSQNLLQFIKQIGYIKFNEALDSDHRAIFCDIDDSILDNKVEINLQRTRLIGTNSTNEEGERYIRYLYKLLNNHNVFKRAQQILEQSITCTSENEITEIKNKLNNIDKIITESMLLAEKKKCSKKYNAPYSPELHQTHLEVSYWNVRIKSTRQHIDSSAMLNEILEEMTSETKGKITSNIESLSKAFDKALEDHKTLLAKAPELRNKYLDQLIADASEREGGPPATLKSLKF
jgi:hypothetical protein